MTNKELIEKLQQFPEDADVSLDFSAFTDLKKVTKVVYEPAMDALPGWITIK